MGINVQDISAWISILTPIILFFWFVFSQVHSFSVDYYQTLQGVYAGFTKPLVEKKGINSGIILNIKRVDLSGYFMGEFDFAETAIDILNNRIEFNKLQDGVHSFYGKMKFKPYIKKDRNPFILSKNRRYQGYFFVVGRLDINYEQFSLDENLISIYKVEHFREKQILKFKLLKNLRTDYPKLPSSFELHKTSGFDFEPYKNVKQVVFNFETRSDI